MSLKHIDLESALRRLADKRIEDAMREGKFDNLAGAGKPLDLEDMPADEETRLLWWALRIMRNNDFTPDEVRWRKVIDGLKGELSQSRSESRVRTLVAQINQLVLKLNTLGTNALQSAIVGVEMDEELTKLRQRLDACTS